MTGKNNMPIFRSVYDANQIRGADEHVVQRLAGARERRKWATRGRRSWLLRVIFAVSGTIWLIVLAFIAVICGRLLRMLQVIWHR
jgi:hypothetical protein